MKIILTPDHKYLDPDTNIIYPGVTEIIKGCGLMGYMPKNDIDWHLLKGESVHLATAFYDKGTLDEDIIDPQIQGYLEAWKKFRTESKFEPIIIEQIVWHPQYLYCGTPDRNGLDIKTGFPASWHIIQGAAYFELAKALGCSMEPYWQTVYLQENGSYKIKKYDYFEVKQGFSTFLSALTIHNWKKLKGVSNGSVGNS